MCSGEPLPGRGLGPLQSGSGRIEQEARDGAVHHGLSLLEEGGGVLLHQSVQRGLLRSVALVVDRGAVRRTLGMPANGLHARLPRL